MRGRLFLIDGSSYIYRAFYALPPLSTSFQLPTNAIYGFTSMMLSLIKKEKPEYLAIGFDAPGPTFRHRAFPSYKATRPPMPEDLSKQLPYIREIIEGFQMPSLEVEGYEADDILATLAKKAQREFLRVFILTPDKDMLQLVTDRIYVWNPFVKGGIYDRKKVEEKFGVMPERIPDYLALLGDPSDNIPGVTGIGKKTAVRLIQEFGPVEKILASCDKIESQEIREKLLSCKEQILASKKLVTLDIHVPLSISWERCKRREFNREKLATIFEKLEFKRFLKEMGEGGSLL